MNTEQGILKHKKVAKVFQMFAALALLGGGVAACGAGDDAPAVDVDVEGDGESVEPDAASDDDARSELPEWFLDHFPVQPDDDFRNVQHIERYGDRYQIAGMNTSANMEESTEWYTEQYSSNGWTLSDDSSGGSLYAVKDADGYEYVADISVGGNEHASTIVIDADRR